MNTLEQSNNIVDKQGTEIENSDNSNSDLNCSDVINMSDTSNILDQKFSDEDENVIVDTSSGSAEFSLQALMNQEILNQLQQIGKRLDKLKETGCKKTSNVEKIKRQ